MRRELDFGFFRVSSVFYGESHSFCLTKKGGGMHPHK